MKLDQIIIAILLEQFRERSPWINSAELRERLYDAGLNLSIEKLSEEIKRLTSAGYLELQPVDPRALGRGFITRLTVPGRNLWVHGRSLTGE
jgi:hypothetical protein